MVEGFPREHRIPHLHIPIGRSIRSLQKSLCGAGRTPHAGRSFFLYEKSVLRESDHLRGRKPEVSTDSTHPFSAPKKPLKNNGNPRGNPFPLARGAQGQSLRL